MNVDTDRLLAEMQLVNHKRTRPLDLVEAIVEPPEVTRTIDGASTLKVTIADHRRRLVNSPLLQTRSWAVVGDVHFELVALNKTGNRFTLTFEDAIVAALRRRTKKLSIAAGSLTRREFVIRLAREARILHVVDPAKRGKVQRVLERSVSGDKSNSWDVLGEVAEEVHWRRFSDGHRLVVGSDEFLIGRDPDPTRLVEGRGPVHTIDFDLDVGKRASTATVAIDTSLWALPPGSVCEVEDLGQADGRWLVAEIRRTLTSTRGTVRLVRKRHVLKEPPPVRNAGAGDRGDPDFLPGQAGSPGTGTAANPARERMVRFALAQVDKPYVWGGSGPDGFDCSGLVQQATLAGGHRLPKPSANQWKVIVEAGKQIPIATALRTRGALLFRIGVDDFNHVAISLGNGSTVEARGSASGIGVFGGASGGGWTGAGLWL